MEHLQISPWPLRVSSHSCFPLLRTLVTPYNNPYYYYSVQFSRSVVSDSLRPHEPQHARPPCPSPTPGVYSNLSIESVMPSSHLILCQPLLLLPPTPPSIRVFSNESTLCMRWPKYCSFSFSISLSSEHPGLISFRMDWLNLLVVQGTLKSLLQHHSSKASIFQRSAFFTVQLSHKYTTTGKTIALTRRTFVGKVMSLLFNMLSRLVITFLLRSKPLLISWLQPQSEVILGPPKVKSDTVSTVYPSISHEVMGPDAMGPDAMILVLWMLSFKPTWTLQKHAGCNGPDRAEVWLWGATPHSRSGVGTESARLWQSRSGGQEEIPTSEVFMVVGCNCSGNIGLEASVRFYLKSGVCLTRCRCYLIVLIHIFFNYKIRIQILTTSENICEVENKMSVPWYLPAQSKSIVMFYLVYWCSLLPILLNSS